MITKTEGAIGYVDVAYALKNKIRFASMLNASGKFATPGLRGHQGGRRDAAEEAHGQRRVLDRRPAEGQPARLPDLDVHLRDRVVELVEVGGAARR